MDGNKRSKALEIREKAQQRFYKRFYKDVDGKPEKRAFFKFLEQYFGRFGRFFMLNILNALVLVPMLICILMLYLAVYDSEYVAYQSNIPFLWGAVALLGLLYAGVSSGTVYIMRNTVSGQHVTFFSDFFRQFGINFKQSFLFGFIDALLLATAFIAWPFLQALFGTTLKTGTVIMLILIAIVLFMYLSMRPYIQLMIVTVNLKLPQIFRNALGFVFLGVKNNILGVFLPLGIAALSIYLLTVSNAAFFIVLAVWLILGFSIGDYIRVFSAYGVFYKYLIQPEEQRAERESELDEDPEPYRPDVADELDEGDGSDAENVDADPSDGNKDD